VVAEIVDLVVAAAGVAQDHVGGGGGGRGRVQNGVGEEERIDRVGNGISVCVGELETARARRAGEIAVEGYGGERRVRPVIGVRSAEDAVERIADAGEIEEVADIGIISISGGEIVGLAGERDVGGGREIIGRRQQVLG